MEGRDATHTVFTFLKVTVLRQGRMKEIHPPSQTRRVFQMDSFLEGELMQKCMDRLRAALARHGTVYQDEMLTLTCVQESEILLVSIRAVKAQQR